MIGDPGIPLVSSMDNSCSIAHFQPNSKPSLSPVPTFAVPMPPADVKALLPSENLASGSAASKAVTVTETGSAILQLSGIEKQYPGVDHAAIADISLSLVQGEILSLLGPSGCGKTTLLRIIAGFEQPQAGEVWIEGRAVARQPPEKRGVGMVFQDYALFPHLTVQQNVAFGLQSGWQRQGRLRRVNKARLLRKLPQESSIQARIQETLELVGLAGFAARYPHELSGGQQQRIALARALAPSPSLVLLDEPMSNLDVQVRLRLRQELREILKRSQTTAIFVTHDQEEALSIADRIAVMGQGRIEQYGLPEEIYQRPATRFVADFVTQANFLPAQQRELDLWETEIGCFRVQLMGLGKMQPGRPNRGEMMVRQEDILLVPEAEMQAKSDAEAGAAPRPGGGQTAVVCDRQFLGREHRYTVRLASGRTLQARMATAQAIAVGTAVTVEIIQPCPQVFIESSL